MAAGRGGDDRRKEGGSCGIGGRAGGGWGARCAGRAQNVAGAARQQRGPLGEGGLLGLVSSERTGGDVVLERATVEDMGGTSPLVKPSLEVVYDEV